MYSTMNSTANRVWVILIIATATTYWVGESGMTNNNGTRAVWAMFGLAFVKGFLIIYDYMELRHAPTKWKLGIISWLVFVISLILFAYWLGQRHN
ncbi:MAG: hypothetical protein RIR18_900 [Pseudomonadota bacterium]